MAHPHGDNPESIGKPYDWQAEGVFDQAPRQFSAMREAVDVAKVAAVGLGCVIGLLVVATEVKLALNTNADPIPPRLPIPVKHGRATTVKVEYNVNGHGIFSGSGVKIGAQTVLTAGHVALYGNDRRKLRCSEARVLTPHTANFAVANDVTEQKGLYNQSQDIALLRVQRDEAFDRVATAPIADTQPEEGDTVFFINYESGSQKHPSSRYPNSRLAQLAIPFEGEKNYGHAAQYAGTVVDIEDRGRLIVATGAAAYGPGPGRQRNTYPGGSGGPVFNAAGEVVGESIAIDGWQSVSSISLKHGIDLPNAPSSRQLTVVEVVTPGILSSLMKHVPARQPCQ